VENPASQNPKKIPNPEIPNPKKIPNFKVQKDRAKAFSGSSLFSMTESTKN
jgi:hypothetical protein